MNLQIKKIRLHELSGFVESEEFRNFETVPISFNRVQSYLNNPRAKPDDIVLYLGFYDDKLVAFRSLFADEIYTRNSRTRFAWCSGNWIHPDYRRMGFSEQLLKVAFNDWDNKLMFTNYAPNSEKLYLKTGSFHPIHQFQGMRAYLFPKTRKLIKNSKLNFLTMWFFSILDSAIVLVSITRLSFFKQKISTNYIFTLTEFPDEECYKLFDNKELRHAFRRTKNEISWIFRYPYISTHPADKSRHYPFSNQSSSFNYHTVKIFLGKSFIGFFIFSVREGHLKTLYFSVPDEALSEIAIYLKIWAKKEKIEMLTVYKKELANHFLKRKFPFLRVNRYGQKIYSSFAVSGIEKVQFQDGDGDVFFT